MSDDLIPAEDIHKELFDDGTVQPWERLDGETSSQYAAFCVYRDMNSGRTINKAATASGGNPDTYRQLSSQHGWVARATAYDDWRERNERRLIERGRLEARRRQIEIGQVMQSKALEGLLATNPYTATPRDLALMADIGSKLVKSGVGEVDVKRIELTGAGGGPIEAAQSLSAADRRELLAGLVAEADRRLGTIPTGELENVIEGEVISEEDE